MKGTALKRSLIALGALLFASLLASGRALADEYQDALRIFQNSPDVKKFFETSYGYALFPTVAKGGVMVGGAYGKGRVYVHGQYVGDATVTQVSLGLQLGGQAYSEIIFFEDERAYREFTSGNMELGAEAGVVVITASAKAQATTAGSSTTVAGGPHDAVVKGNRYNKGLAIFVVPKGGLMYEISVSGQKFTFKPRR